MPGNDDKCYVYATLPATPGCEDLPAIGLIAHMDTTPDMTGKDVKPRSSITPAGTWCSTGS